jgi:transcriptional regulator with XRE-family HTH domain
MKEKVELLRLKEVLSEKGVTGKDLAKKVNVTPNTISNIISGNTFPTPKLLEFIAMTLDVDIRELFKPTKSENNTPEELISQAEKLLEELKSKI